MKQHPIPQNILDIEFKLFSKFTMKEFIYIAIGMGSGAVFLFLMSSGTIPPIIGLPLFFVCAAAGLFLGLVKINDQKADVYLKNFVLAITTPTQRVWRNKEFDDKFAQLFPDSKDTKGKPKSSNSNIIAGNTEVVAHNYVDQSTISSLDVEEQQKLDNIANIAQQTGGQVVNNQTSNFNDQQAQISLQAQPVLAETPTQVAQVPPQQPSQPQAVLQNILPSQTPAQQMPTPQTSSITIGTHNIQDYQLPLANIPQVKNTINLLLLDTNGKPVNKAITMVKDSTGKIASVKVSNQSGLVITGKQFPSDKYSISIQSETYTFPEITFILEGGVYPPVRVKAIK